MSIMNRSAGKCSIDTRKGKGAAAALDAGFNRAYSTIVDSNVTALIATALLFWFGS
jgi:SecD/SecF fusion protein